MCLSFRGNTVMSALSHMIKVKEVRKKQETSEESRTNTQRERAIIKATNITISAQVREAHTVNSLLCVLYCSVICVLLIT